MVKAKRPVPKQKNQLAESPSKIKSKGGKGKTQASKKSSKKSGGQSVSQPKKVAKRGKKQLQNEEAQEEQEEEMINTSKTRSRKPKDLSSIVPKIG